MKFIRFVFSIPFAILLFVMMIGAGAVYSVREAYSEEKVTDILDSIDWAELEIPTENGTTNLCTLFNEELTKHGMSPLSSEEFNTMIQTSSADQLASETLLKLRAWFFDGEERPEFDTDRISEVIAKGAGYLVFDAKKIEIRLPSTQPRVSLLSADNSADMESLIDSSNFPPDYAAVLKKLAKEHPDLDLAELMALLENSSSGDLDTAESASDLPLPSDDASDLMGTLIDENGKIDFDALPDLFGTLIDGSGNFDPDALADLLPEGVDASELFDALTDEDGNFDPNALTDLLPEDVDITKTMEAIMQMQIKAAVESQLDLQDAIVELDNAFDDIEPYRIVVSTLAMIILIGCACLFIIILVSINKNGSSLGLPHIGFASVLSGLVFLILSKGPSYIPEHLFAEYHIPESTFALITSSLLTVFGTVGTIAAIVGAIIFVLGILLGAARR